ncbi:MAG TPA: protein-glutamate O-methyltransferase CheR [Blastocatellia bacterium]|nr:protein-glutamate O-methyltransferase CheR [Blastocatellia bacterium]
MASKRSLNPHIKILEQAMAARFGWQTNASWRDKLVESINAKAEKLGFDEMAYCRMAVRSPGELEVLADMVNNCETRFFREPEQFEAIKDKVLPYLMKARSNERRLNLWSVACSTGEEAYSLAILLSETLPSKESWKTSVLATDLRGSAIISASKGHYTSSSLRLMTTHLRNSYFSKAGQNGRERSYEISSAIKKMVSFRRANIYDTKFWGTLRQDFDLIVCNNLLIYFHALAVQQTVERIAKALRAGGLLIVMKNEAGYVNYPGLRMEDGLPGAFFRKV